MTAEDGAAAVLERVHERTGLVIPERRQADALRQIRALVDGAPADDWLTLFDADPGRFGALMDALTIDESYFFRIPTQFEFIRDQILPALALAPGRPPIRVWSAGCAAGQEAYSLAILLTQAGLRDRATVVGTDLSEAALTRARGGRYTTWALRHEGAMRAERYLQRDGDAVEVAAQLRPMVTFAQVNLRDPRGVAALGRFDLILCRHVLIYLSRAAQAEVARLLLEALTPGGWLMTAASDPALDEMAPLVPELTPVGICYRAPGSTPAHARREAPRSPAPRPTVRPVAAPPPATRASVPPTPPTPTPSAAVVPPPPPEDDVPEAVRAIRAKASSDGPASALRFARQALRETPLSADLHYCQAVLLVDLGRLEDAALTLKQALYLDRALTAGYLLLGTVADRLGDGLAARRAYRQARQQLTQMPPGHPVRLISPERADSLAALANRELERLGGRVGR